MKIDREEFVKLVDTRYKQRKHGKGLITAYTAPEIIENCTIKSDQVLSLIDVLLDVLNRGEE